MISRKIGMMIVACVLLASSTAYGQIIINAFDQGWYDDTGLHTPPNPSYAAGYDGPMNRQFRSWFLFPVAGLPPVASAALRVYSPITPPFMGNGYVSPDPTETFQLYDVTTGFGPLTAGGIGQTAIYADLGSGADYGSRVYSALDNGQYTDIPLTAAALANIPAAPFGFFAIGGTVSTLSGLNTQSIFAFSHQSVVVFPPRLVITPVPEPSSLALGALGVTCALQYKRRHRKAHNSV